MINIVKQLPINSRTSEVLCESGLELRIVQVGYAQTIYDANVTFECVASDTGEAIKFVAFSDNTIHLEDRNGNEWKDKVIAVVDDMEYPIYSTQAKQTMEVWRSGVRDHGLLMILLTIGSIFLATQNFYIAIPFLGMAVLSVMLWLKERRKVKQRFRVWGEPEALTV